MKVFLTGGTGFIGRPLTEALLGRGWEVTALVRNPESVAARNLGKLGARWVKGDITDRESMRAGMAGADIVIHNAAHYEFGIDAEGRKRMQQANVAGTEYVLGLAQELAIPHSVYVSSTLALGDTGPQLRDETFERQAPCYTHYEQTKTEAHQLAREYQQRGLPLVIVCPNMVIGANSPSVWGYFLRVYLNKMLPPFGWSPGAIYAQVEVHDLAEGVALAAEKGRPGEMYLLGGESKTLAEILEMWALKPGAFKIRFWLPTGLTAAAYGPMEPFQRWAGLPAFISRESVLAATVNSYFSNEKAKRELGWSHRPAQQMWSEVIDQELELLAQRKKRDLISRLKPLELED